MAQVAWAFLGTCVKYLRPFDRQMMYMYTDINFEHISTTFILTLN